MKKDYLVSIIVPVFNEEVSIAPFMKELDRALEPIHDHLEIIFVNDGSRDNTVAEVNKVIAADRRVSLVNFSRNFGKEPALSAGLRVADGDFAVPMDVDLQDPPEVVLEFLKKYEEGDGKYDTVYGLRADRSEDTMMKRFSAEWFYHVFNFMSSKTKIPVNVGDFRLIDRRVIDTINKLSEKQRFMKGLFACASHSSCAVSYTRPERAAGSSKFHFCKLWNFALDGIFSFSSIPVRIWSYIGLFISSLAFLYMIIMIAKTLYFGIDVPGYPSIMCVVLFLGGVQLISIGVVGEYVGRIYYEVKGRPLYVIDGVSGRLSATHESDGSRKNPAGKENTDSERSAEGK